MPFSFTLMETLLFILYPAALLRVRLILPALLVHGWLILASALSHGRVPLIGTRDTLGFLAWTLGIAWLAFRWNRKRDASAWLTIVLILALLAGSSVSPVMRGP